MSSCRANDGCECQRFDEAAGGRPQPEALRLAQEKLVRLKRAKSWRLTSSFSNEEVDEIVAAASARPPGPSAVPLDLEPTGIVAKARLLIARFRALGGIPELCDLTWTLCNENEELKAEIERLRAGHGAVAP